MMTDLFNAIYTYYLTTSLSSSLTGGLHNTEAKEDVSFPYGTFSIVSIVPDWTFDENLEDCLIQFNLFSNTVDATEVCSLFELLKTAFDFYDLTIANYETVSLVRENAILTRAEKIWQYSVTYRILLGKS